jgi:hypothetical protein
MVCGPVHTLFLFLLCLGLPAHHIITETGRTPQNSNAQPPL